MGELRQRGRIWWIRYSRNGKREEESSHSTQKSVAIDLLRLREGKIAAGSRVSAKMQRLRFDEAAADVVADYRVNEQSSVAEVERRIRKHLQPFFGGRRMTAIGPADVRDYIVTRQASRTMTTDAYTYKLPSGRVVSVPARTRKIAQVSNAEINRELSLLRRMFNLAIENEKLMHGPYVPLLQERNVRKGFFERPQLADVQRHLPSALQPVVEFAYITGWRIDSEVLPLQWTNVNFDSGDITLDPDVAKNDEPRTFPMTDDLRVLLERQWNDHIALARQGHICPFVFFRMVAKGRRGPKSPKRIKRFDKAWAAACRDAGCPGKIPHDFRRTAVRNMVRRGVPERVAMQLAGHKTRSVFERYNIVSPNDLRAAAQQLQGLTGTAQQQVQGTDAANQPAWNRR
jgi:integrase